jgi:peptidoglycan/xylan/chitin deacetylase (PgdA/CDA1 family)
MCYSCVSLSRRGFCGGTIVLPLRPRKPAKLLEPTLHVAGSPGAPRSVAITLDACPGMFDWRIAKVLVERHIPATIFITEVWMGWNPGPLEFLKSRPDIFTLENHGARHLPPVLGSAPVYGLPVAGTLDAIRAEVQGGASAIIRATGRPPAWYRGAAGLYSPEAILAIEALGVRVAGYSLNSDEGASLPAASVARRIAAARDGDVIEGHINQPRRESGAGIATGLAALHDAGVRFVGLGQAPVRFL